MKLEKRLAVLEQQASELKPRIQAVALDVPGEQPDMVLIGSEWQVYPNARAILREVNQPVKVYRGIDPRLV
jgi:hypothetical protein